MPPVFVINDKLTHTEQALISAINNKSRKGYLVYVYKNNKELSGTYKNPNYGKSGKINKRSNPEYKKEKNQGHRLQRIPEEYDKERRQSLHRKQQKQEEEEFLNHSLIFHSFVNYSLLKEFVKKIYIGDFEENETKKGKKLIQ